MSNEAFSMSGMNATAPQPRGWEYHELWNLPCLSKILQGKRNKKTLDLIGLFFNGGSNPLGPLFGSRKTHGFPALLMDDILHLQRLDGKVSRMEHLHPSLRAKLHCRTDVNKNQEPPNQNPTRLLSDAPFQFVLASWRRLQVYIYIYISIVYLYVDFDANLLWKILGQFFVQREQSFTRHHVAPNSIEIIQTSFGSLPFRKTIHGGWMGQIFNLKSWDQSSSICLFDGERQKTYSLHSDLVVKWQFTLETS